ncbi:hypothetical protein GCM10009096_33470 [Parasphingorhabdus litoris]|uniref:Uncharacterized protein n=1 Tax=Parasphingorhabdus litoris TaxID=394733 RepID=A0ABN1B1A0_9SPHN|nr:hypothetical protein [Parasphingorhabdus litoris]
MWIVGGIAVQSLSILSLRQASETNGKLVWLVFGLLFFALSIWLISNGLGLELGLTWALTTISVAAYALILYPFVTTKDVGHERVPSRLKKMPNPPSGSKARLALRLFSAGPLYLVAALALSLIVATKPWAIEITRLFTGGLLTPLFWSIGALHATVDESLWRVAYMPVLITAVSALGYFLL